MNILYIGSSGALSLLPFKKLLDSSYTIKAVGVYKPIIFDRKIIALDNESLALSAQQNNIPVIDLSSSLDDILNECKALSIDVILMSCYARRLPDALINSATKGCFNMHPSLLPGFRGSEPIFWQMKQASELGVSWHYVTNDFDAGDIVNQKRWQPYGGESYLEIAHALAAEGASLLIDVLAGVEVNNLVATAQQSALANYQHYPRPEDFVIDTAWTAQHAYNFMCATHQFGMTYRCQLGADVYLLEKAVDYDNNDSLSDVVVHGNTLSIPCSEGVLIATYTGKL